MMITFLFSSDEGDIPVIPDDLKRPFLISPSTPHPFLTLGDYFQSIEECVIRNDGIRLREGIKMASGKKIRFSDIHRLLIRSEKHGALYHIVSLEMNAGDNRFKFALNIALDRRGRNTLMNEFQVISRLNEQRKLPYLPRAFCMDETNCGRGPGTEILTMAFLEWFEGYHEWHFSRDERNRRNRVKVWDQGKGKSYLSDRESYEIFRQAARILTLYYDTGSYHRIYPWHNSAGDFIVKIMDERVDVRLTTARDYSPFITFTEPDRINPLMSLVYFFLDLTIGMRLDRLDGLGDVIWADEYALNGTITGFFEGLSEKGVEDEFAAKAYPELLALFKCFGREEMIKLFNRLMAFYKREDPDYYRVIESHLFTHVDELKFFTESLRISPCPN